MARSQESFPTREVAGGFRPSATFCQTEFSGQLGESCSAEHPGERPPSGASLSQTGEAEGSAEARTIPQGAGPLSVAFPFCPKEAVEKLPL